MNEYHTGFYPIIRLLAALWTRVAEKDIQEARALALAWSGTHFLLLTRLHLYTLASARVFAPEEAAMAVCSLADNVFWRSGAQVEIMRLLTARWAEFADADRGDLERRICEGIPREIFQSDALDDEEWASVNDGAVFRRLKRISAVEGSMLPQSRAKIDSISQRHPQWAGNPGDRDDFPVWVGSVYSGPHGDPKLLSGIADDRLVPEAMRIQGQQYFAQGDLWIVFCRSDPERALRGLRADSEMGRWDVKAWEGLLWAAQQEGELQFQQEVADALLLAPNTVVAPFVSAAVIWLQQRREMLSDSDETGEPIALRLWEKLANLVYDDNHREKSDQDLVSTSLSAPAGKLAWILYGALLASQPNQDAGISPQLRSRFDRVVDAPGEPGLLARVFLSQHIATLNWVDPAWVAEKLIPRFEWSHPEAAALWQARAYDGIGLPRLFNALKPAFLQTFTRRDLPEREFHGFVGHLLGALLSGYRDRVDYDLSPTEVKAALVAGPPEARRHASWYLWHWMAAAEGEPTDKVERWRGVLGPLFRQIWPLDAQFRDHRISHYLVQMALRAEDAFPEVVSSIVDFLVPYDLHQLAHSLRLEREHDALLIGYPQAFLRLANALIDPRQHPIPGDLGEMLQDCAEADPSCRNDPSYIRLFGLSRRRSA